VAARTCGAWLCTSWNAAARSSRCAGSASPCPGRRAPPESRAALDREHERLGADGEPLLDLLLAGHLVHQPVGLRPQVAERARSVSRRQEPLLQAVERSQGDAEGGRLHVGVGAESTAAHGSRSRRARRRCRARTARRGAARGSTCRSWRQPQQPALCIAGRSPAGTSPKTRGRPSRSSAPVEHDVDQAPAGAPRLEARRRTSRPRRGSRRRSASPCAGGSTRRRRAARRGSSARGALGQGGVLAGGEHLHDRAVLEPHEPRVGARPGQQLGDPSLRRSGHPPSSAGAKTASRPAAASGRRRRA
jgi:hypothetical protein